jgi:hypothetical protein
MNLDVDLMRRYSALRTDKRNCEESLRKIKDDLISIEETIVDSMLQSGVKSLNTQWGMLTVVTKKLANPANGTEDLIAALKNHPDFRWLVKDSYHAGQMRSAVREYLEEHGDLPEELKSNINIFEQNTLSLRSPNK